MPFLGINPNSKPIDNKEITYPYLLVNVKGGVSFYKVNSTNDYQRVGGSILGESAFQNVVEIF